MNLGKTVTRFSTQHPWLITGLMLALTAVLATLATLPSLWPDRFPMLQPVAVDTDPENMLSEDEPVRVFHDQMKYLLSLHDMVVLGVVNEEHPDGVFNPETLRHVYELTEFALTLRGDVIGEEDPFAGVIARDVIAPSTVDNIDQGGPGTIIFEWLMPRPPETREEALAVRDKAMDIPFLNGTLVSEDGKALAVYLPLSSKDLSYKIYKRLQAKTAELGGDDQYYITGLPVAEDTFGVEMFIQMAISAPLAMLVIFLLMLFFFRKLLLIVSPMIVAMVTVICTMAGLVATGNTIHIMSSMIPIFLMPIAVLDSIHILSEFFDRYQRTKDRRKTALAVMDELFMPMLYTSLTSAAGFASLALTPIPPVQVFGLFVAMGIMLAWLLTITFIPAYIMFIPERKLEGFGMVHAEEEGMPKPTTGVGRFLLWLGGVTYRRNKLIIVFATVAVVVAAVGISQIEVNDNPTRWFKQSHPIRVADRVLNEHFGGTYMAYLAFRPPHEPLPSLEEIEAAEAAERPSAAASSGEAVPETPALPAGIDAPDAEPSLPAGLGNTDEPSLPAGLGGQEPSLPAGLGGEEMVEAAPAPVDEAKPEVFKQPEVLDYLARVQQAMLERTDVVGKSNSLTDIVKTVHRELIGSEEAFRVPDSPGAVAQVLSQYQNSHRRHDLWHFVTPDYRQTSIWVQLKSGDNRDMSKVVAAIEQYLEENPLTATLADGTPVTLEHQWFGLTYINVEWQEKMVTGMLQSFLGSFLVVLVMMIVLFRSGIWGFLSMVPLTITIGLIYGVIGFIGKDYDMPVAVLSSLTLGLAVDFAIHFLARTRALYEKHGSWEATHLYMFGEPARAITRNVIVIAVGFLPLLFAPLVPYITVGIFLASILLLSGAATLVLLPALVKTLEPLLFPKTRLCCLTCQCGTCLVTGVATVALVAVNVHQFVHVGWTRLSAMGLVVVPILAAACWLMSRRAKCSAPQPAKTDAA